MLNIERLSWDDSYFELFLQSLGDNVLNHVQDNNTEYLTNISASVMFMGNQVTVLMDFTIELLAAIATRHSEVKFTGNKM